ncbi:hypothetical protein Tsubulata_017110 [Turnera subulata]|uniref:DUF1995 domain-containing protein n=1 Tax=Turnera subulata TaxID=218843 RepID=A0A9Q0FL59_9ROSI|nr:hypothetical protein Tsubulata_017110 [Turnera subulata]
MASNLLKLDIQATTRVTNLSTPSPHQRTTISQFLPPIQNHHRHHHNRTNALFSHHRQHQQSLLHCRPKPLPSLFVVHCSATSLTPPTTKGEAIRQVKTCLAATLSKPLNNVRLAGKLKKLEQPRFQVEFPVIDDSPADLSQLALKVFTDLDVKSRGSPIEFCIIWPTPELKDAAVEAFQSQYPSSKVVHVDLSTVKNGGEDKILGSADVAVFFAPQSSQLPTVRAVCKSLYILPVVMFNPTWAFEDETDFGELNGFVNSFGVIYSYMGLEVQELLRKRKGMVFKCASDGIVSGEKWAILVEEEDGQPKVVSRFKTRPSTDDIQTVLYNAMAVNSPITKSVKFFKDLVSNLTGQKS